MRKFLNGLLIVLSLLVVPQLGAPAAKADVPMTQFVEGVNIGVSLDTTYQYVFNCDKEKVSECPAERGLYAEHNDFSIDAFTLSLEKEADGAGVSPMEKIGFRADILFGEQAEYLGFGFNSDGDGSVSPYQAYVSVAPSENFGIIAGQFTTLAGWELIEAKNNTNITRGLLFYRIPFAHSGVRASYNAGAFDLTFGISNDWDAVDDVNDGKTFEFQAAYSHSSETGFINDLWAGATVYVGKSEFLENRFLETSVFDAEGDGGNAIVENRKPVVKENDVAVEEIFRTGADVAIPHKNNTRTLLTLVTSVTSGKFTFVGDAEFTWVQDGVAKGVYTKFDSDNPRTTTVETSLLTGLKYENFFRWGVGGYAIYQPNSDMTLSLRAEYVDDSDTTNAVKLFEITPTVGWKPFGETEMGTLETRFEYRMDRADIKYFRSDSGLKKTQHALIFQLLYFI